MVIFELKHAEIIYAPKVSEIFIVGLQRAKISTKGIKTTVMQRYTKNSATTGFIECN